MVVGNWYAHGVTASKADHAAYIGTNLKAVYARIARAAALAGRPADEIGLVAVSKTFPAADVLAAYQAGQRAFGESYVQEAIAKIETLSGLTEPIEWHFIGPIQSNKTRAIAECFAWVHGVDRLKIAERLSQQRPTSLPPLQLCLQVNVSGESTKAGVIPEEAGALARLVVRLPNVRLRGLMCIPEPTEDVALQRLAFSRLRQLMREIDAQGIGLDTLSMGMTDDLDAAVAEGATLVRVGRAIFGERK